MKNHDKVDLIGVSLLILHIRMLIHERIVENDEITCASHRSVDNKMAFMRNI